MEAENGVQGTHLGELEDALLMGVLIGAPHFSHHQLCHVFEDRPVHEVQRVRLAVAQHPARHALFSCGCGHNSMHADAQQNRSAKTE